MYKKNLKEIAVAKKLNEKHGKLTSPNPTTNVEEMNINTDDNLGNDYGRRIIYLKTLGKNMFCSHCKFLLSSTDLESEKPIGVASILYIKCRMCQKITGVSTDKQHTVSNSNSHYDSNTQLVIGALIGYFSKKVIANVTLNRKYAKCDRGHLSDDHDCRMNFVGSAKAMEPHAAMALTKDNPILQACNIEVGIFIADNDSSSICAVKAASHHEVLKQSDKNHTSQKTSQFVSGASSNSNESLNAMIVSKAPKSRVYSKSTEGDGRVACAISKINLGEKYVNNLTKNLKMSSGIHRDKFCNDIDLFNKKKYANSLTRAAKSRRVALRKSKTALKNRHEAKEGTTYKSNIRLRDYIHESFPIVTIEVCKAPIIVFFDLETYDLISSSFTWDDACNKIKFAKNLPQALKNLELLKDCVSVGIRKKMIVANVTFEHLEDTYKINKYAGIAQLLGKDENGVVKVTKAKKILDQIFNYFESKEKKI
ncbi:hypothetical protein KQX54_002139 [Cotesia glomerata]|uniref:Uncharacterized protein n=1 Tax=Cotesia glomerata TaxID=32391 RepID=A0AAV7ILB0_COTGL|nr:hypothetical protein KQX54_002139 [Cotesia glomerata]